MSLIEWVLDRVLAGPTKGEPCWIELTRSDGATRAVFVDPHSVRSIEAFLDASRRFRDELGTDAASVTVGRTIGKGAPVKLTLDLDVETAERLRRLAEEQGKTVDQIVQESLDSWRDDDSESSAPGGANHGTVRADGEVPHQA